MVFWSGFVFSQTCVGNLVQNPGFENGTDFWSGGFYTSGSSPHSGTKCGVLNTGWGSQEILDVEVGATYNLTFWARLVGTNSGTGQLVVYKADWTWINQAEVTINSTAWQQYSVNITIPAGTGHLSVAFSRLGGEVKVDDICVVKTSSGDDGTCANNLLQNSGFELGHVAWDPDPNQHIDISTTNYHSGTKSGYLDGAGEFRSQIATGGAISGHQYKLTFWADYVDATHSAITLIFFGSGYNNELLRKEINLSGTGWKKYSITATAPSGTQKIQVGLYKHTAPGRYYIDDVCLEDITDGSGAIQQAPHTAGHFSSPADVMLPADVQCTLASGSFVVNSEPWYSVSMGRIRVLEWARFGGSGYPETHVIPGPYPPEFNSSVTINLNEIIVCDGYITRAATGGPQSGERVKIQFFKDGVLQGESASTPDLADDVEMAQWIGSLGTVDLPNGTDEIKIYNYGNSMQVAGICMGYVPMSGSCPEFIPQGEPTDPLTDAQVDMQVDPNNGANPGIVNSITVQGEPNPFTYLYLPTGASVNIQNPSNSIKVIDRNVVTGISGQAGFTQALINANADRDLDHYMQWDATVTNGDYINFTYAVPIKSAKNRYVVITERLGNNPLRVNALDQNGNTIGSSVNIAPGTYLPTGFYETTHLHQQIYYKVYPLTAIAPRGTDIYGIRLTQTTGDNDGGDCKVFILADPFTLNSPPAIDGEMEIIHASCTTGGRISFNVINNLNQTVETSIHGAAGPFTTATSYNNLAVGDYTLRLRYQGHPNCYSEYPFTIMGPDCTDSDGDGIIDVNDLDDDNDGIPDVNEDNCDNAFFFKEDFGTGTGRSAFVAPNYTSYLFSSTGDLDDGLYALVPKIDPTVASWVDCYWLQYYDHTPGDGSNGLMALFNASFDPGVFFQRDDIAVPANTYIELSFWVLNVDKSVNCTNTQNNRHKPNIQVGVTDASGNEIKTMLTGDIERNDRWNKIILIFDSGSNTSVNFFLNNRAPGGLGNDLAIDDIQMREICDADGDGIPNLLDLDSDNDNCPDAKEGVKHLNPTNNASGTGLSGGTGSTVTNNLPVPVGSGFDNLGIPTVAGNGQGVAYSQNGGVNYCDDSDGDGVPDSIDLDDDNDGILDKDEGCDSVEERVEWSSSVSNGATTATFENSSGNVVGTFTTDLGSATNGGYPQYIEDPLGLENGTPYVKLRSRHQNATVNGAETIIQLSQPATIEHFVVSSVARNQSGSYDERQEILFYLGTTQVKFVPSIEKAMSGNGMVGASYNADTGLAIGAINFGNNDPNSNEANFVFQINQMIDKIVVRQATGAKQDNINIEISGFCTEPDTDNDGIPDRLDLDSDNDGCPDAKEGGMHLNATHDASSTGLSDGNGGQVTTNLPGPVGTGVNNKGVPTIAGNGQGAGSSRLGDINYCLDSDGDGIPDDEDLDDDNDGIRDTDEGCTSDQERVEWSSNVSNGVINATFENSSGNVVGTFGTDTGSATTPGYPQYIDDPAGAGNGIPYVELRSRHLGGTVVTGASTVIQLSQPATIEHFVVKSVARNKGGSYNEKQKILFYLNNVQVQFIPTIEKAIPANGIVGGSYNPVTGLAEGAIDFGADNPSMSNEANFVFNINQMVDKIVVEQAPGATNDNISIEISGFCTEPDTDNDGIPNRLDLDSDNDGCPDSKEGGNHLDITHDASGTALSDGNGGQVTTNLPDPVGTGSNLGIPTVVGNGQAVGGSQNSGINYCLDSDNDRIPDAEDLDDDNDGILDVDESDCVNNTIPAGNPEIEETVSVTNPGNMVDFNDSSYGEFNNSSDYAILRLPQVFPMGSVIKIRGCGLVADDNALLYVSANKTVPNEVTNPSDWVNVDFGTAGLKTVSINLARDAQYLLIKKQHNNSKPLKIYRVSYDSVCSDMDTDGDGIPNRLDLDSDNDGCLDALEGSGTFTEDVLVNAGGTVTVGNGSSAENKNLCGDYQCVRANGVPNFVGSPQGVGGSQIAATIDMQHDLEVSPNNVCNGNPLNFTFTADTQGANWKYTLEKQADGMPNVWNVVKTGDVVDNAETTMQVTPSDARYGSGTYRVVITNVNNTCVRIIQEVDATVTELATFKITVTKALCSDDDNIIKVEILSGTADKALLYGESAFIEEKTIVSGVAEFRVKDAGVNKYTVKVRNTSVIPACESDCATTIDYSN